MATISEIVPAKRKPVRARTGYERLLAVNLSKNKLILEMETP
jgi:hypothetical protein